MDIFSRGFKAGKCKTLLRLAMSRIKLLRNKRDMQVKAMRKEIANLIQTGQEPSARIRVEHIFREQNILAAYEIVELFCELIVVRLPIIESQKQCPLDLKEAIASLIFAAPRCADLPELLEVRGLFAMKYGKEFVAAAGELRPDCGVNRRIIEKLSVRAPSGEIKLNLLKEIAVEHNVDWDPSGSEAELLKQHEDLLDGPSQFLSSSQRPLAGVNQVPSQRLKESPPSELPSVPVQNPRAQVSAPSFRSSVPANDEAAKSVARPISPPSPPQRDDLDGEKQFIPFVMNPPPPLGKYESSQQAAPDLKDVFHDEEDRMDYKDVAAAAQAAAEAAERAATAARAAANLAKATSMPKVQRAQVPDEDSSDDEVELPSQTQQPSFSKDTWERNFSRRVESSSSDSDEDSYPALRETKPTGRPRFDGEDDDTQMWRTQSVVKEPDPRTAKQQSAKYDIFDMNAEQRLQSRSSGDSDRSSLFKQGSEDGFQDPSYYSYDRMQPDPYGGRSGEAVSLRSSRPDIPSYDVFPSASLPLFDEPEAEAEPDPVPPNKPTSARTYKTQTSIPPQRPPPEVPKPAAPTLSPTDSGLSSSSSGGLSVHPKLPDYDDLAARFQLLKSKIDR